MKLFFYFKRKDLPNYLTSVLINLPMLPVKSLFAQKDLGNKAAEKC